MAKPIPLTIPPRDPRAELQDRLDRAPVEHADAILSAYDVIQALHDQGVLDIIHGAVSARNEILTTLVDDTNTPTAIRVLRNLMFGSRVLDLQAPEAKPPSLFSLFRRLQHEDTRRALAALLGFLESFGRHLKSLNNG
jgi:uncharacterized protein YjgD (DUF1641 family)